MNIQVDIDMQDPYEELQAESPLSFERKQEVQQYYLSVPRHYRVYCAWCGNTFRKERTLHSFCCERCKDRFHHALARYRQQMEEQSASPITPPHLEGVYLIL
jgi:hypothetical protein